MIQNLLLEDDFQTEQYWQAPFSDNFKQVSKFYKYSKLIKVRKLIIPIGSENSIFEESLNNDKGDYKLTIPDHSISNTTTDIYFTEDRNDLLWLMKIFAEKNHLSHIKVKVIDDKQTDNDVLIELLGGTTRLNDSKYSYRHPTILGYNEHDLYESIDQFFNGYKSCQGKINKSKYRMKYFPMRNLSNEDDSMFDYRLMPVELRINPWKPCVDDGLGMTHFNKILEPESETMYTFSLESKVILFIISVLIAYSISLTILKPSDY